MLSAQTKSQEGVLPMNEHKWANYSVQALVNEFFEQDDLHKLAEDTGILLECPLLIIDETFHIAAHFSPPDFSDKLFGDAVYYGMITYELGAIISKNDALCVGKADYIKLDESIYKRRFAPLISAGVRLGYLICVDTDGHLQEIPTEIWQQIEMILSKQLFIETSRQDKPFETTEEILMHLLGGGFPSEPYFRLQTANTYLSDFKPTAFALIDLTVYNNEYAGKRQLKEEIRRYFANSHDFVYKGDVFLFLHSKHDINIFAELANEFGLKVIISDPINSLFELPELYRTAHEALEMLIEADLGNMFVSSVANLRTPLMLKNLSHRKDLIPPKLINLAEHDKSKDTMYLETLYYYLISSRSLKKTCDALFTHRNTVLYRIRRIQEDFLIPLDDAAMHTELLLGTALLLFEVKGATFFANIKNN